MNKSGARPSKRQKIMIASYNLDPEHWLIVKDCANVFEIRNKKTKQLKQFERVSAQ